MDGEGAKIVGQEIAGVRFTRALNRIKQTQSLAQSALDLITGEGRPEKVAEADKSAVAPSVSKILREWPEAIFELCGQIDDILVKIKEIMA